MRNKILLEAFEEKKNHPAFLSKILNLVNLVRMHGAFTWWALGRGK